MKTIYKYQLKLVDQQEIEMPEGAEILTVQTQNREPHIWAIVDTDSPMKKVIFKIYGTGQKMINDDVYDDEIESYVGTFQLYGGNLVFHCFEIVA